MTPQKAILDSLRTLSWFVSCRRLSSQFQFSLSAGTLEYLSQWLILRQMGTLGVLYIRKGSSLLGLLGSSCRYNSFLSCLGYSIVNPVQNISFPRRTLFHCISPHHPATWAGSRAGSPVFVYHIVAQGYGTEESCFVLFFQHCSNISLSLYVFIIYVKYEKELSYLRQGGLKWVRSWLVIF